MILFLVLGSVLLLVVLAVLVRALRRAQLAAPDREGVNVAIFRERLAELDGERDSGRIGTEQHAALVAELQRLLVDDVAAPASAPAPARTSSPRLLALLLLVLIPALVIGLQLGTGFDSDARAWLQLQAHRDQVAALPAPLTAKDVTAQQLELRDAARLRQTMLERNPQDAEAWLRLGVSWIEAEVPVLALESLRTARRLAPQRTDIALTLARIELMLGNGQLNEDIRELLDAVLAAEPGHQGALLVYGMAAFDSKDYGTAVQRWQQLLVALDPKSQGAGLLRDSIARAQAAERAANAAPVAAAADAVPVRVVLASALGVPPPDATLFVIVRAAGGPPMPIAAKKLPSRLPVDVVITDADQMMAGAPLAQRGPLEVVARLSRSGTPMAASGDLQSAPVRVNLPLTAPITLTIDQRLP